MGWGRSGTGRCKEHPQHSQSEGVCSSCLRERLAKLSSIDRNFSFSGEGSDSEVMGSIPFMISVTDGLKKSRSMAYVPRNKLGQAKNKTAFWRKFIRSTNKKGAVAES